MKNTIWYFDLGFVSMLTLCTLSVGRMASFYSIGPLNGKVTKYCTALKIVLSIWVYSLALSLPPLVGWGRYVPELSGLGWVYLLLFHIFAYWHLSFPDWVINILWSNILKLCTGLAFKKPKYHIRYVDFDIWISDSDYHNSVCFGHNMPENPRGIVKLYIQY